MEEAKCPLTSWPSHSPAPAAIAARRLTQLAAQAAAAHTFNETALRQTLGAIAQRSRATGQDIDRALEEEFRQGVAQAMSDGILTRQRRNASAPSGTTSP